MTPPVILTIAGSDSSGGAGIQADIKTISALGGYAASVITAVTAQNTLGVLAVHPLPPEIVRMQIEAVVEDLQPTAIKIGMVHNADIVRIIAECLKKYNTGFVVYDPVMISTSGRRLMTEDTVKAITEELFPLCTLITPNLSEASLLGGRVLSSTAAMQQAAQELSCRYRTSFLIKGGHLAGNEMCDVLYCKHFPPAPSACMLFTHPKIQSHNLHGTGCTLSSAIATFLAHGNSLDTAVCRAKEYINAAILRGKDMKIGQGNGPLWHFPVRKDKEA